MWRKRPYKLNSHLISTLKVHVLNKWNNSSELIFEIFSSLGGICYSTGDRRVYEIV